MFTIKSNLLFNGRLVGYRLSYSRTSVNGLALYDISLDDWNLIEEDFNVRVNKDSNIIDLNLVERGTQLVTTDGIAASELTYGKFAQLQKNYRLAKTDTELKKLYNHYNKLCFNNSLPSLVAVEWSKRMTSGAGVCELKRSAKEYTFTIRLSTHYHERYPEEVIDTLVHEMIHVLYPREHHGPKFKNMMNYLNRTFDFNLTVRATGRAKVNYVYVCEDCGYEYERVKKINTQLSHCGVKRCKGELTLKEDYTEDMFDDTDWGTW